MLNVFIQRADNIIIWYGKYWSEYDILIVVPTAVLKMFGSRESLSRETKIWRNRTIKIMNYDYYNNS